MKEKKEKILKIIFIIFAIGFAVPSIIYLVQNKTVLWFRTYFNFFIQNGTYKVLSTILYLVIFTVMTAIYTYFIKKKCFKNIKRLLIYTGIIGAIFLVILPWTSTDIFYYMGVGELNAEYGQNPYYTTIYEYCLNNEEVLATNDEILLQGTINFWRDTTVVYGPVAQMIFSGIAKISFKNVDICLLLFKLVNLIAHMINCYLVFKLTKKMKFAIMYALNPFILFEGISNVHNEIIIVMFILFALYFLIKKKQIIPCIVFLALATDMKFFTILLAPLAVLYYLKDEESIPKKLIKCIKYGLIFVAVVLLGYVFYYRDMSIFFAVLAQAEKYGQSIFSLLRNILCNFGLETYVNVVLKCIRTPILILIVVLYIKLIIDLLKAKEIKFSKVMRKYNMELVLLLLWMTCFHMWYVIWLFPTLFYQKSKTIKRVLNFSFMIEIANSVYMFLAESEVYNGIIVRYNWNWICVNRVYI